jgi:hypothetical protein
MNLDRFLLVWSTGHDGTVAVAVLFDVLEFGGRKLGCVHKELARTYPFHIQPSRAFRVVPVKRRELVTDPIATNTAGSSPTATGS